MKTYSSGRPRVHTSPTVDAINAAVAEYEKFGIDNPEHKLTPLLLECAADLREEIELRAAESRATGELVTVDRLETLRLLRDAAQWLGKMIADGGHNQAVMPNHCLSTLARVESLISKLEKKPAGVQS